MKSPKVYFMTHTKNIEKNVPNSGVLTFETFRKSPPLFGTERSIIDNRIYGYARVSTNGQNEDRQLEALTKFGVPEQNIIIDKASGKDTEREGYQYLKRQILRKGDTLVIKELDRLSRNKVDIKRELEQFKEMGVRVKILDIPTTLTDFPPDQAWVLEMINAILIEVLGAIAENERNKIRARQREGIVAAKKKNVRFGRPSKPLPDNWREVLAEVRCGKKKPVEAMRELDISRSCYYRLYNRIKM